MEYPSKRARRIQLELFTEEDRSIWEKLPLQAREQVLKLAAKLILAQKTPSQTPTEELLDE